MDVTALTGPMSLDLEITNRCNLRCRYCYHFESPGDVRGDLPTADWLTFFEELGRSAVFNLCLCGGEPFLREDLAVLLHGIVRNRMRYSLLSNGTLINDRLAALLAETERCDGVQVSIDGSIPSTHDSFRGKGSFARAVRGIRCLQFRGVPVTVRVTIHRKNVQELDEIAGFLLEELGLPEFSTNSATYMGSCRRNRELVCLTVRERIMAMERLMRLEQKYPGRISATAGPLAEGRMWAEMEKARRERRPGFPGGGFLTGCGGPYQKLSVRADGVITPCNQMNHLELGRINRDELRQVWQNHPELERLRERNRIPLESFAFCRGCEYIPYCTGNCPALAYTLTGMTVHPSPDACLRRFLAEGGTLPDLPAA